MGVTAALPFLEAMVPAGNAAAARAAADDPIRLIAIEEVHGLPGCNEWGAKQFLYAPEQTGSDFKMVPNNAMISLEAYREHLTIISNTDVRMAEALSPPEIGGDHFRSSAVFLTQSHPKQTQGSDLWVGTSMDQMYAKRFGQDTPLPSMQFCIENLDQAGGCTYNYSCAYTDSISWATPNQPLPMIRDPRVAFDMLFGVGSTAQERAERRQTRRSILDWVLNDASDLRNELGAADRVRMDRYLDTVREIERRIEAIEAQNNSGAQRQMPDAPAGVPDSFAEHMKIMFDLQVLALEADMTRVISFKTGRDADNRQFPESGFSGAFHSSSHHGNNEERIMNYNKICSYRVGMVPHLVERMKNTMIGDASLLDKSLIVWGSPMADGNIHNHRRCPMFLLGHANGKIKGNVHLKAPDGTPMANVMLTLLHMLGHDDMEHFGDSTGEFSLSMPTTVA
jgi:hypothetical protein